MLDDTPDLVLIDLGLPGMSGIEGIHVLKRTCPRTQLLVLTVYGDDTRIFEALCAGACGYLLKTTPPSRLLESIGEAMTGGAPMSPEVANRVIRLFRQFRPPQPASCRNLTPQEARVLNLLADGYNYETAACRTRHHREHHPVLRSLLLRKIAGTLQIGGRCQGASAGNHPLARLACFARSLHVHAVTQPETAVDNATKHMRPGEGHDPSRLEFVHDSRTMHGTE